MVILKLFDLSSICLEITKVLSFYSNFFLTSQKEEKRCISAILKISEKSDGRFTVKNS